jgi:hypothetical protein
MLLKSAAVSARPNQAQQRTNIVFSVFWLSQLVNQDLYRIRRRPNKAETAQVTHLLSCVVIEAIGEVDLMVQEGTLRSGGREDSHGIRVESIQSRGLDMFQRRRGVAR